MCVCIHTHTHTYIYIYLHSTVGVGKLRPGRVVHVSYTRNWESKDRTLQRTEEKRWDRENVKVGRKATWVR